MTKYTYDQLKPSYIEYWDGIVVVKEKDARLEASKIIKYKAWYQALEAKTGVPWFVIGIIHTREAGSVDVGRWQCVLHNGERIVGTGRKTTLVPEGRGPFADFDSAALDALHGYRGQTWSVEFLSYTCEKFNGFGYRGKGIPSPYLVGGTNHQRRGKYVSDGNYDPTVMDPQIGCLALLEALMLLDPEVSFGTAPPKTTVPGPSSEPKGEEHVPAKNPTSTSSLPKVPPGKFSGFVAIFAASLVWLKEHRLVVVLTAAGVLACIAAYTYLVRHKLWSNPSPKAIDSPVQESADDKADTPSDVK